MRTDITPEHAEHNAQVLKDSRARFEQSWGFEDPPSGDNGWIAPDGKLWAIPYTSHDFFCDLWLGEPERVVEKTYVKLSASMAHWAGTRITSKQKKTLFQYGYDPEEVEESGTACREDFD